MGTNGLNTDKNNSVIFILINLFSPRIFSKIDFKKKRTLNGISQKLGRTQIENLNFLKVCSIFCAFYPMGTRQGDPPLQLSPPLPAAHRAQRFNNGEFITYKIELNIRTLYYVNQNIQYFQPEF